ncbi:cohesin loading factor-domain-containing protein [Stachybotrys elegans]|uniref:Cohesin loading factor-domain-containing protein n=1 Tax=Stachybotrys elegans TaxID=80388 RepID=A0A8K0SRJ3_9HYPO|nr:cohesin loading factor-domain-containing protein [Stachybotrys elegans]
MTYPGMGPSGQGYTPQQEQQQHQQQHQHHLQQYASHDGYQHHQPHQQPQLHHHQSQNHFQQLHAIPSSPNLGSSPQLYPGQPHHAQYMHHQLLLQQQQQQQHQQQQQQQQQQHQQQQHAMQQQNQYGATAAMNMYQGFDGAGSMYVGQQSPVSNYMPPADVWQQPMQQISSPQQAHHQVFRHQSQQQHQQPNLYSHHLSSPQQQQHQLLQQRHQLLQLQTQTQHQPRNQQNYPLQQQSLQQLQHQQRQQQHQHAPSPQSRSHSISTSTGLQTPELRQQSLPPPPPPPPPQQQHYQHQQQQQPQQSQSQQHHLQQQQLIQTPPPPQPQTLPVQPQPQYVNLQDIQPQQLYVPSQFSMGTALSKSKVKQEAEPENTKDVGDCIIAAPPPPETPTPTPAPKHGEDTITVKTQSARPPEVKTEFPRVKTSPRSSVSMSPAPTSRSPSISKRSPAVSHKPRPVDTLPIMMAVAEECLGKAHASVHDVAMSMHPDLVDEYQKLIATSLACFEAALQGGRLAPREEARVRLRYAALLHEETENLMEAETTLNKGIALCDKHRLFDLKYCMQYLMLKVLFQRNPRAALTATDKRISDCETFKHVQWYYAFRLLKASFFLEMGHGSEASAFDNLRAIQNVAKTRGTTRSDSNIEKVQACVAHAAKHQLDQTVASIPQIAVLTPFIEIMSTINTQHPDITLGPLRMLQKKLDESDEWHNVRPDFLLPIRKQTSAAKTISDDTSAIIRTGNSASEYDFVVMSFMTKMEMRSVIFAFSGLVSLHKPVTDGRRTIDLWREGLKILDSWDTSTAGIPYGPSVSLNAAVRQRTWRLEGQAYFNILLGLLSVTHCRWDNARAILARLEPAVGTWKQPMLTVLHTYLNGAYHQGIGDFQTALRIFSDDCFTVVEGSSNQSGGHDEIALLANMNKLWVMQHPTCRNDQVTLDMVEQLQHLGTNHPNLELRIAWHNCAAALETDPPASLNVKKNHMHTAIEISKITNNFLGAAITLCIMRSRFFENVVGQQALKSGLAAARQAYKSGCLLWQSVADGMLSQSYDVQGQKPEAMREWEKGTQKANAAFARIS